MAVVASAQQLAIESFLDRTQTGIKEEDQKEPTDFGRKKTLTSKKPPQPVIRWPEEDTVLNLGRYNYQGNSSEMNLNFTDNGNGGGGTF